MQCPGIVLIISPARWCCYAPVHAGAGPGGARAVRAVGAAAAAPSAHLTPLTPPPRLAEQVPAPSTDTRPDLSNMAP